MTPILWIVKDTQLSNSSLVKYNIFYYIVDLFRNAFIYNTIETNHLVIVIYLALMASIIKGIALTKYRDRVVYWL
jgi:ABC-type polysaccharide/polyol phosphate export permease